MIFESYFIVSSIRYLITFRIFNFSLGQIFSTLIMDCEYFVLVYFFKLILLCFLATMRGTHFYWFIWPWKDMCLLLRVIWQTAICRTGMWNMVYCLTVSRIRERKSERIGITSDYSRFTVSKRSRNIDIGARAFHKNSLNVNFRIYLRILYLGKM